MTDIFQDLLQFLLKKLKEDFVENMVLTLEFFGNFELPWLLKRKDGKYDQHFHFKKKKEAVATKKKIEANKYPSNQVQKEAMLRLLSEEEFKNLNKKDRYFNPNKGIRHQWCY